MFLALKRVEERAFVGRFRFLYGYLHSVADSLDLWERWKVISLRKAPQMFQSSLADLLLNVGYFCTRQLVPYEKHWASWLFYH